MAFSENDKSFSITILDNSEIFSAWSDTLSISLTVLNNGKCTIDSGVVFLDLLTNLERVSDHSCNIANRVESN